MMPFLHRPLALAAVLALTAGVASAHDGPPYPVLVDRDLAGHVVSIWADPDVGIGTFYVYVSDVEAGDPVLRISVWPTDEHKSEAAFTAVPAEEDEPFQLVGEVDFDRRGEWEARFHFEGRDGSDEVTLPIDVTPPGAGTIDLIWFLGPFLALAFLWVKVFLKRREMMRPSYSC